MAKVRPTRSVTVDKLVGKNVLVYINFGEGATEAAPVWTLIGGQRSASLSMTGRWLCRFKRRFCKRRSS